VKLKMPGLTRLAQLARVWLEKSSHTAEAAKHQAQIDKLTNEQEVLQRTVATLIREKEAIAEKAGITA
jgi:cell division protein FtsB